MRLVIRGRRTGQSRSRAFKRRHAGRPWRSVVEGALEARGGVLPPVAARVAIVRILLVIGFSILVVRLFCLQILDHSDFSRRAMVQQERRVPVAAVRGDVVDREGRVLLHTLTCRTLVARPAAIADRDALAKALAPIIHRPAAEIRRSLSKRARLIELDSQVDLEEAAALGRLRLAGLSIEEAGRRVKLIDGCDLLGAVNRDGVGDEGIERAMEEFLRGQSGWETRFTKADGRVIPLPGGTAKPATPGDRVVLTIDASTQWMVEDALARAVDEHSARGGSAVLVEVESGEVIALAAVGAAGPGAGRRANRLAPIEDTFEPGSTFKIVTFAAALDKGLVDDNSVFFAENGRARLGPCEIRDVKKMGWLCTADVIAQSSNIATAKIGLQVGAQDLYAAARRLGFGMPTHIELPGEVGGILRPVEAWSGRSTPTVAIGQEVAVTSLQMVMAYAAIAGGGELRRPRIVREVIRADGQVRLSSTPEVVRRVMSPETAATLTRYLTRVVEHGTGKRARVPGVLVAGKTGTAQKARTDGRGYAQGRYVSSFIGFFPADRPRYALTVSIDEPAGMHYGGEVAAPVFREVATALLGPTNQVQGLELVSVPAERKAVEAVVPDLKFLTPEAARARLAAMDLIPAMVADGERILTQEPEAGSHVPVRTVIKLGCEPAAAAAMPDVQGLSLREALSRLRGLGLEVRVQGSGRVVTQSIAPGTELKAARLCRLVLDTSEHGPRGRRQPTRPASEREVPSIIAAAEVGGGGHHR